jgi:hypothetical protein
VAIRLVGIAVFNNAVVQDDVDQAYGFVLLTPATVREVVAVAPGADAPLGYALQLDRGSRDVTAIESRITSLIPPAATSEFHVTQRVVAQV